MSEGLFQILPNKKIYIGVDKTNVLEGGSGRHSVQIKSKAIYNHALFILDLEEAPEEVCGTWKYYMLLRKNGIWPDTGETKIIENVNENKTNWISLHCGHDCLIKNSTNEFTGHLTTYNCNAQATNQFENQGCLVLENESKASKNDLNKPGNGIYATLSTSNAIIIWFFPRNKIPASILNGQPEPSDWKNPLAKFAGGCNIDNEFKDQQILFSTTFSCGWAADWNETCTSKAQTCVEFVQQNPQAFNKSHWIINSLKVYSNETIKQKTTFIPTTQKLPNTNKLTSPFLSTSTIQLETTSLPILKNQSIALYIGLFVATLIIVVLLCSLLYCFKRNRHQNDTPTEDDDFLNIINSNPQDPWQIEYRNLRVFYHQQLGFGHFACVYVGELNNRGLRQVHRNFSHLRHIEDYKVAVKTLPMFASKTAKDDFQKELDFMKSLKYHQNLACLIAYTSDATNTYILLEYCSQGDLLKYLRANKNQLIQEFTNNLNNKTLLRFAWEIANGLNYFTSLGFVHRDVAARNVLLDSKLVCKLGDFGLSRTAENEIYTTRGGKIPVKWSAIESLRAREYSMKSDVWSYGVVLYELFSLGATPYPNIENINLLTYLEAGNRMKKPNFCNNNMYDLMLKCWAKMPEDRPNFSNVCKYLMDIHKESDQYHSYVNK